MGALLEVRGMHVGYGQVTAVRDVSFTVGEGELVALIGPNGAGKTTTLSAVAGLLAPAAGEVRLAGESVTGAKPGALIRAGVALVREGRHVFTSLSVRENLEIGASIRRPGPEVRADLEWTLELFPKLRELLGTSAGSLSGGEQQQLAIARALMSRPRLLMLDEPSLGLAPLIVKRVFETIERLRDEHAMSILLVEQNARAATRLAERTYVLRQGSVALSGTRAELAGDHAFETAYLGF